MKLVGLNCFNGFRLKGEKLLKSITASENRGSVLKVHKKFVVKHGKGKSIWWVINVIHRSVWKCPNALDLNKYSIWKGQNKILVLGQFRKSKSQFGEVGTDIELVQILGHFEWVRSLEGSEENSWSVWNGKSSYWVSLKGSVWSRGKSSNKHWISLI